jgi:hypothetical protein
MNDVVSYYINFLSTSIVLINALCDIYVPKNCVSGGVMCEGVYWIHLAYNEVQ